VIVRLLKLLAFVGGCGAFVWWGLTVPLGEKTFFGHVHAIGQSRESQELVRGTRDKVDDIKKKIGGDEEPDEDDGLGPAPAEPIKEKPAEKAVKKPAPRPPGPPQDRHTEADRKQLRRVIEAGKTEK
jgi:hypothetical protein